MPLHPGAAPTTADGDGSVIRLLHDRSTDSPRARCLINAGHTASAACRPGDGPNWHQLRLEADGNLDQRARHSDNVDNAMVMGLTRDSERPGANGGDPTCEANLACPRSVAP